MKITLDVPKEKYESAGSKFITFNPEDKPGKRYYKQIEMDVPDWDQVGVSLKFPVRITGNDIDAGKEDKISTGVSSKAVWKLKEILRAFGTKVTFEAGADGKQYPSFDTDAIAGHKAVGAWEITEGSKGGDSSQGITKYPKLVAIYPSGYDPEFDKL